MKTEIIKAESQYEPTEEEIAELEEMERMQRECPHSHKIEDIAEDGCLHCGFYSK